ncbi:MAG: hypothetical protein GX580_08310 [Candidatus Hydrogenedens sp.]|nr:hypothetical protein [Candidatus Hydrogenedentota bacterium]NLF57627.1 hypothetical protein [Candidatus Hydrogenedens sp.]
MNDGIRLFSLPDNLSGLDFSAHNEASRALWAAFAENTHERVPIRLNTNPRMLMLDPAYNTRGLSYREYMTDPELMGQAVLEWAYWTRFLLPGDHEKGLPEVWRVHVDFENVYDAAWFGAPVEFHDEQVPYAAPLLNADNRRMLFDRGIPGPFAGEWAERALRFWDYFHEKSRNGWTFFGRPVEVLVQTPMMCFDGAFTAAASLRGATDLCTDLLMDPDYVHELLDYITEAAIARIQAWRTHFDQPLQTEEFGSADDSVEMLSVGQYREFALPRHRRLYDTFCPSGERGIHLCGNAQRLFPVLREELGITAFDTGFPVDFARFREEMGPDTLISGGPRAPLFVDPDPAPLLGETRRILRSGVAEGGRLILQEGNNLPPRAPLDHCAAFYRLGREMGRLRRAG